MRLMKRAAVSFGASLLTIDPANERGTALFDALVRRTFAALEHHSAGLALGFDDPATSLGDTDRK